MEQTYTHLTLILSFASGLLAGMVLVYFKKFPKNQRELIIATIILLISPKIGVQTYIIGDSTSGILNGICLAPFLASLLLVVASAGLLSYVGIDLSKFIKQRKSA